MDTPSIHRPRFKASVQPVVDGDDGLILLTEVGHDHRSRRVYRALAPLLDGAHDVEAIFDKLAPRHSSAEVLAAMVDLRDSGFLAQDDAAMPRASRAFWEHSAVSPTLARHRLESAQIAVHSIGEAAPAIFRSCLEQQGLSISNEAGDLAVVLADDYLSEELAAFNERALRENTPWLLVKPWGITTLLGPVFIPGETACWACLAQRLRWHRRVERYAAQTMGRETTLPKAHIPSSVLAPLAEAATELARWVGASGHSALADVVVATSALSLERTRHPLRRRPQCPSCGDPRPTPAKHTRPVKLTSRPVRNGGDGGHRARPLNAVLVELEGHVSPITGVVGCVEPGERSGPPAGGMPWRTPNFAADHNFSDMHEERFMLREGMRRRSGGKGKSTEQARASAIAESLERHCGVFDGTELRVRATFQELGAAAIHPNAVLCLSAGQYRDRSNVGDGVPKSQFVPPRFCVDTPIEWTPLTRLCDGARRYLPTSQCYFGYRSDDPIFARADSNGCAAGGALEEAVLQGLLELIERDAVAIWWYNRIPRPAVDLSSAEDPYVAALIDHYRELRREVFVLDITGDVGVPTFAALSRRTDQPSEDIIYGFGAHLDPEVALSRALTELNQSLEAVPGPPGSGAQSYRGTPQSVDWWTTVRLENAPYLAPMNDLPLKSLKEFANRASGDLRVDIERLAVRLRTLGIDVLVLDQTRPDVGFPVVRVVAPGLRHFWARYGPGRLYEVPVRLGWVATPTQETALNPHIVQF
ncbi:MAG: TOMM precursor leader peptide-binding protein [Pseudomonadota bacterium]